jgi:glyoxylase I family protein
MQTPGLSHVILTVSDLDRSRAFYGDLLGFQMQEIKFEGGRMFFFVVGGVAIWFLTHPQIPKGDCFSEFRIGLDHLAFKATNEAELKVMADKLIAAKYVAFRDPDNIQLEYWLD